MKKELIKMPLVKTLHKAGVKPNHLTILSLIIALTALTQQYFTAMILFSIAFMLDLLDGNLARRFKLKSEFGGVLDSTIDRVVDLSLIYYLGVNFNAQNQAIIAGGLSILISYIKHRSNLKIKSFFDRWLRAPYLIITGLILRVEPALIIYNILVIIAITQLMAKVYEKNRNN